MVHTTVRQLTLEDTDHVKLIVYTYLHELVKSTGVQPNMQKIDSLIYCALNPVIANEFAVGTFVDGKLVAIIGYTIADRSWWSTEKAAYDSILYCREGYRGYGFTKRMLAVVQDYLKDTDVQVQYLGNASKITSERTLKLYNHLGFKLLGYITEKEI